MRRFPIPLAVPDARRRADDEGDGAGPDLAPALPGLVVHQSDPAIVYGSESLAQTLRQLSVYGRDGLPVLSGDGREVQGWITNASVLQTVAAQLGGPPTPAAHSAGRALSQPRRGARQRGRAAATATSRVPGPRDPRGPCLARRWHTTERISVLTPAGQPESPPHLPVAHEPPASS
jgi:hypothetical protein